MRNVWILVLGLVLFAGCKPPSMNLQRSFARGTGDTSVTAYLDRRDAHDVDEKKARIMAIVDELETFLDEGQVGDMAVGAFREQVNRIVPANYRDISDAVLSYLSNYEMPTDRVPEKVVRNIKATLKGIRVGLSEYKLEDRRE